MCHQVSIFPDLLQMTFSEKGTKINPQTHIQNLKSFISQTLSTGTREVGGQGGHLPTQYLEKH